MAYLVSRSLIISDLDGTLLQKDKSISKDNLKALQDWTECGGDFTIATGRSIISASHRISNLPITCPAVVFNGGVLYDYRSRQLQLKQELISEYREIVAVMLDRYPKIGVEIMTEDIIYLPARNDIVERHMARESLKHTDCPVDKLPASGAIKVLFGVPTDQVDQFLEEMKKRLPPCFYPVRTDENYCEMMLTGVDKGKGLETLKHLNQSDWDCVIAFGDFFNDLPLFETATIAMATANAPQQVKRQADYVVSSNDESALFYGIELLLGQGVLKK